MLKQFARSIWLALISITAFVGKELRLIWHQPRLVFLLILGPFLILSIFGLGYRNTPRTLDTLFVVPENSTIAAYVEGYAEAFDQYLGFAGIVDDATEADSQLRNRDVDLVVVTPPEPANSWENGEQAVLSLYHHEIDPLESTYIEVVGREYAQEINRQILVAALDRGQQQAGDWQSSIETAKSQAATVREALAAGDTALAASSATSLKDQLDALTVIVGAGLPLVASVSDSETSAETGELVLAELKTMREQAEAMEEASNGGSLLSEGEATAASVEASLENVDLMLQEFESLEPAVLAAPFRTETLSITQVQVEPMHFYVPAVIALLLQHIAVTLAGLSIIREKIGGTLELIRAAPVTAAQVLLGKYTSYMLLIGFIGAVLTALVVLILGVPQLGSWVHYAAILTALILASLGIGFHISLSARSDSQAIQYGMLTLLAAIFFSGFFMPLYRLAPPVQIISWLLPATYGTRLLQDVMLRGQIAQPLLLVALFLFGLVLLVLAAFRMHRLIGRQTA